MPRGVYPRRPRPVTPFRIDQLRAGDPLPPGEPRRYRDAQGYVRLRWKIGVRHYAEIREHRLAAAADTGHVHHRDHRRDNNAAANLVPLTAAEHMEAHGLERRRFDRAEAAILYAAGVSTTDLGRRYGVSAPAISRALRRHGVAMRPAGFGHA